MSPEAPGLDWAGDALFSAPDRERMRGQRGARLRASMAESGIDALILLGTANVAYATGATWPLGFAGRANIERPVAVVRVDDPMPFLFTPFLAEAADELGLDDDHLHGPAYLDLAEGVESFAHTLATIVPHTATIAVDELTGAMQFLDAEILDAGPALRAVRRTKTGDEVVAVRRAVEIADASLAATLAELRPGTTERQLTGVLMEAMSVRGVNVPEMQALVRVTSDRDGIDRRSDEVIRDGDLVAFHAGVSAHGYAGEVGRTWPAGRGGDATALADVSHRSDALWRHLLEACRPGAPGSALLDAYAAAGEPLPVMPIARGLGLGGDDPVIARHLPETAAIERLDPGLVLVVTGCVFDDTVGSVVVRQPILITQDGSEVLSSSPSWNRDRVGARR